MKKKVVYSIIIIMLVFTSCTIGGSFYMLNFSLTPNAKILSKDADRSEERRVGKECRSRWSPYH